jgi:hypothetical protein
MRLPRCCRFLRARRSLAACSLEPTPEGRLGYFQPTDATQTFLLSTSLHPCSRRSRELPESPPVRSRIPSVHADELASAGPLDFVRRVIRSTTPIAIFASDASVVIPLRVLWPRSHDQRGLEPPSPPPSARRDATPTSLDQRRLRLESIRAPLPFRRSRSLSEAARLESRTPWRVTPLRCATVSFRLCGLALNFGARKVFPRS